MFFSQILNILSYLSVSKDNEVSEQVSYFTFPCYIKKTHNILNAKAECKE